MLLPAMATVNGVSPPGTPSPALPEVWYGRRSYSLVTVFVAVLIRLTDSL